ncbi:MAG: hypothetical protein CM1200mP11_4280 [Nitrosopumilaceae archaeon]|nr:MAG: hypothetical protein CM1200mP11_4280 [Nitrosopumilaceae archaeon]
MTREQALEKTIEAVEYGKSRGLQVEFSAEDATRTDRDFLKQVFGDVQKPELTELISPNCRIFYS